MEISVSYLINFPYYLSIVHLHCFYETSIFFNHPLEQIFCVILSAEIIIFAPPNHYLLTACFNYSLHKTAQPETIGINKNCPHLSLLSLAYIRRYTEMFYCHLYAIWARGTYQLYQHLQAHFQSTRLGVVQVGFEPAHIWKN